MKKKLFTISITIAIFIVLSIRCNDAFASVTFMSDKLNAINASAPVSLGTPIVDVQILGSLTHIREDGDTIFYAVTSGAPAIFFAYNVDKNIVEANHYLQSADGTNKAMVGYCVVMDSKGMINIATQSSCMFFRYNPKTDVLKSYGNVFAETAVMSTGYVDAEDNFYFGTYPNAKLIKYDAAQDKLIDLGTMISSSDYVRALGGYGDKIVMSGVGNPITPFVKYDIKTKVKTPIVPPSLEGKFTSDDVTAVYAMNTAGKYLFAQCKISTLNKYYLCVFDMETEQWIDYIENTYHMHTTTLDGNLVYLHKYNNALGKVVVHSYNVITKELIPYPNLVYNGYMVSPGIVNLKDQIKYPGKTLVSGANTDGLIIMNLEKQEITFVKSILPAQSTKIRTLKAGYNNELILSAYMGTKFVIYDTVEEEIKCEPPSVQIEGIGVFDGKYYFGLYGKARLTKYDPNLPSDSNSPNLLSDLGTLEQDRAFVVTKGNDSIIWGSVPDYGRLGGAVGIYDLTAKTTRSYNNIVPNQSIGGLAYRNGKIYGSTHIFGGLGIDPIVDTAKLFVMDYNTGNVEKQVDIRLKTDTNTQYFAGGMSFGPDGNLWVATAQTLLCVDPSTLEIKDEIKIGVQTISLINTRYLPYNMEWDKNGILYTNIGYKISAVDIKTKEVKQLCEQGTNALTLAENGNLYFMDGDNNYFDKIVITKDNSSFIDPLTLNKQVNLSISNANFESWVGTTLKNWSVTVDAGNSAVRDTSNGTNALKVTKGSSGSVVIFSNYLFIPTGAQNCEYTLMFDCKTQNLKAPISIGARAYDSNNNQIAGSTAGIGTMNLSTTAGSSNWQLDKSARFNLTKFIFKDGYSVSDIASIRLVIYTSSTDVEGYIDNIRLFCNQTRIVNHAIVKDAVGTVMQSLKESDADTDITATLSISDSVYEDFPLTVLIALYDKNNKLLNVSLNDNSTKLIGDNGITVSMHIPPGAIDGKNIKIMTLKTTADVSPVFPKIVIPTEINIPFPYYW